MSRQHHRPGRPAIWHGTDPCDQVARQLGWWTLVTGVDHLVEDYAKVLVATALGQLKWNTATQQFDVVAIDEAALEEELIRPQPGWPPTPRGWGEAVVPASALTACPDCHTEPGQNHHQRCTVARCPECAGTIGWCEVLPGCRGSRRPARWHGIDPLTEVAWQLQWWTLADGVDHLVEDGARVHQAAAAGMITWDRAAQRYIIGQIDEAALDHMPGEDEPAGSDGTELGERLAKFWGQLAGAEPLPSLAWRLPRWARCRWRRVRAARARRQSWRSRGPSGLPQPARTGR